MPRPIPFDPTKHVKIRAPVLRELNLTREQDGSLVTVKLGRPALERICNRMNQKWEATGDTCAVVVGHTLDGKPETEQPPKVADLYNYAMEPFEGTGEVMPHADYVFPKDHKLVLNGVLQDIGTADLIRRFPRRSGEVWYGRDEIDPISMLGATSPEQDLGLLRLSASGAISIHYNSPGDLKMPAETNPDGGPMAELTALLKQSIAMQGQTLELLQGALQPPQGAGAGADAAAGAHPQGDDSLEAFMKSLEDDGEKPKEDAKPKADEKPKEDEEKVKLARERDDAMLKLARVEVQGALTELKDKFHADIDPTDEKVITDLMAIPKDIRDNMLVLLRKGGRSLPGVGAGLTGAVASANSTAGTGKKMTTNTERDAVIKLAKKNGRTFEAEAVAQGFTLN